MKINQQLILLVSFWIPSYNCGFIRVLLHTNKHMNVPVLITYGWEDLEGVKSRNICYDNLLYLYSFSCAFKVVLKLTQFYF